MIFRDYILTYERHYGRKPHTEWTFQHMAQHLVKDPRPVSDRLYARMQELDYHELQLEDTYVQAKIQRAHTERMRDYWRRVQNVILIELMNRDYTAAIHFEAAQIYANECASLDNEELEYVLAEHSNKAYYTALCELVNLRLYRAKKLHELDGRT